MMNSTKKNKHPHGHVGGHLGAKRKKDKPQKQPRASKLHILACHGVGRVDLGFMYAPLLSTLRIGFEALGHEPPASRRGLRPRRCSDARASTRCCAI